MTVVLKPRAIAQGPGTADEVKSETSPDEREGKEPAIAKPVESTPVTEAPIEAAPKETGI